MTALELSVLVDDLSDMRKLLDHLVDDQAINLGQDISLSQFHTKKISNLMSKTEEYLCSKLNSIEV